MNKGSWNSWLSSFELGERRYIEVTDAENYAQTMRTVLTPRSRRPESMNGMEWEGSMFTAIGVGKLGNIRYLLCIERIK